MFYIKTYVDNTKSKTNTNNIINTNVKDTANTTKRFDFSTPETVCFLYKKQ